MSLSTQETELEQLRQRIRAASSLEEKIQLFRELDQLQISEAQRHRQRAAEQQKTIEQLQQELLAGRSSIKIPMDTR